MFSLHAVAYINTLRCVWHSIIAVCSSVISDSIDRCRLMCTVMYDTMTGVHEWF